MLVFFAIPVSLYLFATSRTARLRREALLDAFVADPARIGRWPEWLHVPVATKYVTQDDRSPSRRSEDREGDFLEWKHWQSDGQVSFWGNVDEVGPSPFDHVPKQLKDGNGKRILFLTGELHTFQFYPSDTHAITDYHDYLERMNTHTYEIVDAAIRHPHVSRLDVWGPKWRYWDPEAPLSENMRRRMWWMEEMESRRVRMMAERLRPTVGNETDVGDANQLVPEDYMTREEMDAWWQAAKEGKVEGCPAKRFDVVWTIS